MADRPTPEQIAESPRVQRGASVQEARRYLLEDLSEAGYVIVHPDDVEVAPPPTGALVALERGRWYRLGWNDCRREVFPDGHQ